MNGIFIVLYGINNLGKSTQAKLLVERLNKEGVPAEYLKYPIYDLEPTGQELNNYLRGGNPSDLNAKDAQTLYTQNRVDFEPTLKAMLESEKTIVAEDYVGTGLAWGIGAGVDEAYLRDINKNLLKEDLAFLFEGERFRDATEAGHKHETDDTLTEKVKDIHARLGREFGWIPIDANQPIETIHEILWARVRERIKSDSG
jgi:dTMP kinase